jgi:hypothetical protein
MLIPAGGEFNADRVIEHALRQDFGPDPRLSGGKLKLKYADDSFGQPTWEYKKKYRDTDPMLADEHHFAEHNIITKQKRLEAFELEKPATFINRPLTRGQLRKRFMRSVEREDIEWRNATLVTKFLNDQGKLYNRYQTRLATNV